ncbi:hypothetical protein M1O19_05450, partial [Dehalococcoidia bacterium]|nr:hypothetical protein [Dehalococcoidia bacterium]
RRHIDKLLILVVALPGEAKRQRLKAKGKSLKAKGEGLKAKGSRQKPEGERLKGQWGGTLD